MKIHWRIDKSNKAHTRVTLFIDEKHCGQLCLNTTDLVAFLMIQRLGKSPTLDTYRETGKAHA